MNVKVELLLVAIIAAVAVVTFFVSLRIRHKQQKRLEALRQSQADAKTTEDNFQQNGSGKSRKNRSAKNQHPRQDQALQNSRRLAQTSLFPNENPLERGWGTEDLSITHNELFSEKPNLQKTNLNAVGKNPLKAEKKNYSDLLIIHLMSQQNERFLGYDLLHALLAAGFRFGDMSIFHRHEQNNGEGLKLFSLASAIEPGTFDMNRMGSFSCPGLTLFMRLDGPEHNEDAFDLFIKTSEILREELNADLFGMDRKPLSPSHITQYRQSVEQHIDSFLQEKAV